MAGTRHTSKPGRKKSCAQKRRYVARWQAEIARQKRVEQGAYERTCSTYSCRFCGGYHVGHTTALKYQARARQ